ncbi:hypothetical protein ASPZODRAFT_127296 [Penicilliopsis zonata CBS 506.65]|uniref:Uncharacterized protein n=1 Tax=Penicilliopsis zonata CBS 506.65 TaxID=1073090 RepID=A0A1L9SVP6_9EURO|nr:hypothetical protein ASPZODRAFT_127296 [Penicilliopsis zonata CBS 506.65]OJJ51259.1 hypothetical protein ASPZODRAFT_127296 [Penicilliopsis zonata CBS 506.65]
MFSCAKFARFTAIVSRSDRTGLGDHLSGELSHYDQKVALPATRLNVFVLTDRHCLSSTDPVFHQLWSFFYHAIFLFFSSDRQPSKLILLALSSPRLTSRYEPFATTNADQPPTDFASGCLRSLYEISRCSLNWFGMTNLPADLGMQRCLPRRLLKTTLTQVHQSRGQRNEI